MQFIEYMPTTVNEWLQYRQKSSHLMAAFLKCLEGVGFFSAAKSALFYFFVVLTFFSTSSPSIWIGTLVVMPSAKAVIP